MNFHQALSKLSAIDQQHLLSHWEELDLEQKNFLLSQIENLNIIQIAENKKLIAAESKSPHSAISPLKELFFSGNLQDYQTGKKIIAKGEVGTIILAGGQGTRLGFEGPKGIYPVSLIKHKSLFQLIAEKTKAASHQAGCPLSIALMTSPLNHQATLAFFETHSFFGLERDQVSFFTQGMSPLLNEAGQMFLENNHIAEGPDGNGDVLFRFVEQGLWKKWMARGIKYLNLVLIDNPLADPFDAQLIGFHAQHHCTTSIKCCLRESPSEKVGLLVEKEGKPAVIEYTEIKEEERTALDRVGKLKYPCANLSLFCFSMDHVQELASQCKDLPWHLAHKKGVWKFERFIFDLLPFSPIVKALAYPRNEAFAPLKNREGLDKVQAALLHRDRQIIEKLTGLPSPEHPFELSQDFYYPTPQIREKWHQKSLPQDCFYIEP